MEPNNLTGAPVMWDATASITTFAPLSDPLAPLTLGGLGRTITLSPRNPALPITHKYWDFIAEKDAHVYDAQFTVQSASHADAFRLAHQELDRIANRLSYVTSAYTSIQVESIRVHYEEVNTDGEVIHHTVQGGEVFPEPPNRRAPPPSTAAEYLSSFLYSAHPTVPSSARHDSSTDTLSELDRAFAWLRRSHQAFDPIDEFTMLMLSLEALAAHLADARPVPWRCSSCSHEVHECPQCGRSTERLLSGAGQIKDFLTGHLGWKSADWNALWRLRSKILHGGATVDLDFISSVASSIPALESALFAAFKHSMNAPNSGLPDRSRPRAPYGGAYLYVQWK